MASNRPTRRQLATSFIEALDIAARSLTTRRYSQGFDILRELAEAFAGVKDQGDPQATFAALMQIMPYGFPKRASIAIQDDNANLVAVDLSPVSDRFDALIADSTDVD